MEPAAPRPAQVGADIRLVGLDTVCQATAGDAALRIVDANNHVYKCAGQRTVDLGSPLVGLQNERDGRGDR